MTKLAKERGGVACPLSAFVNIVSGKWALPILYQLIINGGPTRFRELQRLAHPITQKELTRHLRLLERRGLVVRTAFAEVPPRVEYDASPVARELLTALEALAAWMNEHGSRIAGSGDPDGERLSATG